MKHATRLTTVSLLLVLIASTGFGWGNATHTHFSKQLGVARGHLNYDEMYGSVLTDAFNLMLDDKGKFMNDQLHHNFMPLVQRARTCGQKAAAFGLASHNDNWGADFTAHQNSFTFPNQGYALVKGDLLAPSIVTALIPILMNAGLDEPTATGIANALAPELGHDLSETAVDLFVKRKVDQHVGADMMQAAIRRSSNVGQLLADTYAAGLANAQGIPLVEAKKFILTAERAYRDQIIQYGQIFMLPEDQAIGALAVYNAAIAEGFLAAYAGVPVTVDPVVVAGFIGQAMARVESDYSNELAQTLAYLEDELRARGVRSCGRSVAKGENEAGDVANAESSFLSENYPNPFNPTTEIRYQMSEVSHVTLRVFDILGREVATLVNEVKQPGTYTVRWDASGLASGTYISRLTTPDGVFTRRMQLLK